MAMAVVVMGLSIFAGYLRQARRAVAILEIENPEILSLGPISLEDRCARTVRLKNSGRRAVTVGELRVSCGCSRVSPSRFTLEPGAAMDVALEFDFLSLTNQNEIAPARDFSVILQAISHAPDRALFRWPIVASVHSIYKRVPAIVEFESHELPSMPIKGEIDFEFHEPIDELKVTAVDPEVSIRVQAESDHRRHRALVAAAFDQFGEREIALRVAPVVSKKLLASLTTRLFLRRLPDVVAQPAFISLGVVQPGSPNSTALVLVSTSGKPFSATGFRCRPAETSTVANGDVLNVVESRRAPYEYTIASPAVEPGTYSGELTVSISQQGSTYTLPVPYVFHVAAQRTEKQ